MEGPQPCEICMKPAMKRHFYLYPCTHCYHRDCLIDTLLSLFKKKDVLRYNKLNQVLEEIQDVENARGRRRNETPEERDNHLQELNRRMEGYLPVECYYCGDYYVETIHDSLIDEEGEAESWKIH